MKKVVIVLFFLVMIFMIKTNTEEYIIPNDAIRFRIIANSNNFEDQAMKVEIKNNIENILSKEIVSVKSKDEAKTVLKENIPVINKMIDNYNIDYNINYGNNYFPEKKYKGVTYNEGYYESLVVTLGNGKGDNWWCLMFPPLCLMDNEDNSMTDVDYRLFIKNTFQKYM